MLNQGSFPFGRRYPEFPGSKRSGTSAEAAAAMLPRAGTLRDQVLRFIKSCASGATADEAADALRESILAIRPRVTELSKQGLIVETEQRRRNVSGRSAIVWRAA